MPASASTLGGPTDIKFSSFSSPCLFSLKFPCLAFQLQRETLLVPQLGESLRNVLDLAKICVTAHSEIVEESAYHYTSFGTV